MKSGIKKGSVALRSNSEVPITNLQERLLGKVGPGTYLIPETIGNTKVKLRQHQFFGSSTSRFNGSLIDKGVGQTKPEVGPGSYEEASDLKKQESSKKKEYQEVSEMMSFHKLRQLFPEKTSISTVQLAKIKPYKMEHVGPGSYAKSIETGTQQPKRFGGALAAAFGSLDSRKLDNTNPSIISNPAPNHYDAVKPGKEFITLTSQEMKALKSHSVFASGNPR